MWKLPLISQEKKWKFLFLTTFLFATCYFTASIFGQERAVIPQFTDLDHHIPFLKWSIWFYISQYFSIPLAFAALKKPENYTSMLYAILIGLFLSTFVFLLYPTRIIRPMNLDNSLVDEIRFFLYLIDSPTNCFPSLHVTLACLSTAYIFKEHHYLIGIAFGIWSLLIIISTVTLKQHYLIDVFGGIFVATLCYNFVKLLDFNKHQRHSKKTQHS